jgi:glycogen synthase
MKKIVYHGTSGYDGIEILNYGFSGEPGENSLICDHKFLVGYAFLTTDSSLAKSYCYHADPMILTSEIELTEIQWNKYRELAMESDKVYAIPIEILNIYDWKKIDYDSIENKEF